MSAKKKTNKPKTEENDTLSEVDLALALSEIDQELARLGISLTPAQLPAYGPASKELQTSQYVFLYLYDCKKFSIKTAIPNSQ